ncbi:MAG: SDR family NAD(P)-dependent oxidoreductase [Paludibacter sp.]|nr:SDR family NAD(P)-dependent oxidoreductase [Paludibacter sp.]
MERKIIFITGSSGGIGKETAKTLAKQGNTVIVHGPTKELAETACKEIKSETGNQKIDYVYADFFSLADIKRMANELKKKYERLDVLINNAGAMFGTERETTIDGNEKTFALNLFAPFLLSQLLLEVLVKSPAARIINVSSSAHSLSGILNLNDIQLENNYTFGTAYGQSKLYLIWVTQHLATELKEKGLAHITVNSLHPGMVKTAFGQNAKKGFLIDFLLKLSRPFSRKPKQGAETAIYLATSKDVENVTGKYFSDKKITNPSEKFYTKKNEKIIWDYCMQITKPYLEKFTN